MIALTDVELVAIDLTSDGWPLHRVPYLLSLNASSPVTCVEPVTGVSDSVWTNIEAAGNADVSHWSTKVAERCNYFLLVNRINQQVRVPILYLFFKNLTLQQEMVSF